MHHVTRSVTTVSSWYGYGSIPIDTFLVGWTSIYQLFWGSLGTRVLTHPHIVKWSNSWMSLVSHWISHWISHWGWSSHSGTQEFRHSFDMFNTSQQEEARRRCVFEVTRNSEWKRVGCGYCMGHSKITKGFCCMSQGSKVIQSPDSIRFKFTTRKLSHVSATFSRWTTRQAQNLQVDVIQVGSILRSLGIGAELAQVQVPRELASVLLPFLSLFGWNWTQLTQQDFVNWNFPNLTLLSHRLSSPVIYFYS